MTATQTTTEDVKNIATYLKFVLTEQEVQEVTQKANEQDYDVWYAVIEDILYSEYSSRQAKDN